MSRGYSFLSVSGSSWLGLALWFGTLASPALSSLIVEFPSLISQEIHVCVKYQVKGLDSFVLYFSVELTVIYLKKYLGGSYRKINLYIQKLFLFY